MSRTRTILVDLQRLQSTENASTLIRLMMACNDMALANQCLHKFKEEPAKIRKPVQRGALMYFVRLQCGHLNEGLKIIQEIKDDQTLSQAVEWCSQSCRESFSKLCSCLKGGPKNKQFQKYIGRIRHQTIFHYDNNMVQQALEDRASRPEARVSKITLGDDISLFRFELSDDIADSIICRHICKIPRTADLRKEIDEIMDWVSDIGKSLLDFGGEFIHKYIADHAAT